MPEDPQRPPAASTPDLVIEKILVPVRQAAGLLGISRSTLYNQARKGRIQLVRSDVGKTFVHRDELVRYAAEETKPVHLDSRAS